MNRTIKFDELGTLVNGHSLTVFQATLSVIPNFGCRLFVTYKDQRFSVVMEDGEPAYFPNIDEGVRQLSVIPGLDHQIVVNTISLVGSSYKRKARTALDAMTRTFSLAMT